MADDQSTQDNGGTVATQQNEPPAQPAQQPPQQSHTDRGPGPGQQLLDAINALPERLVHAIQEATPKQTQTRAPSTQDTKQETTSTKDTKQETKQEQQKTPGKKSFAEWWFGS